MVLISPTFMPITPLSNHSRTCPDPTVNISGVCSVFWSNSFPSGNVAIYVTETKSPTFTLFLLAHHAITNRENHTIRVSLKNLFISVLLGINTS